jgi:hypothetical protein
MELDFTVRRLTRGRWIPLSHGFDYIEATHDVTVAVVRDELFAFELDRTDFLDSTIDWRRAPFVYSHRGWKRCGIPEKLKTGIFGFMAEVGQHFARVDFLRKDGPLHLSGGEL